MGAVRAPGRPGRFLIIYDFALENESIMTGDAEVRICHKEKSNSIVGKAYAREMLSDIT